MFDNNRYLTRGVKNKISLELQVFMWDCIDNLKKEGAILDYLQVFAFTKERADDVFFQKIHHKQEVPMYSKTYRVFPKEMVDAKVYLIDDGDHTTMMLAEEY